jgi:menaquinone-dependent protoporphyrinogen oxidase
MPRILVTYASRFGSTRGVAGAIAEEISAAGFDVVVLYANPELDLSRYDGVVIGSPSYGQNWLPRASMFVVGNAVHLSSLPVAMFTTGMLGVKSPKSALREHNEIISTLRELAPGVSPVSTALFHGLFEHKNLPLCLRIVDRLVGTPQGDHRNWEAIRSWARKVAELFTTDLKDSKRQLDANQE